jgi:hypothetical protein
MSLILQHPAASPSTTIVLPSPEWNDEETLDDGIIPRHSRGGDLLAFQRPNAVQTRTVAFEVHNIVRSDSNNDLDSMEDFFITTAGEKIKVTDAESRVVQGFVVTDVLDVITVRDDNPGRFDIRFELMEDPE